MKLFFCFMGILIPFIGTSLGSSFVYFLKNKINKKINKLFIGFAIGVMNAASIFSLLLPSIEMGGIFPSVIGLLFGFLFLVIIDNYTNRLNSKKIDMLFLSVTLHNIPEGMAVGVSFAGYLLNINNISLLSAFVLSIGIAIQNIPEGAIISLPFKNKGNSKTKSFIYGVLSGVVEPIGSILTLFLINLVVPLLPYLLSFASGCMLCVIFLELVNEIHDEEKTNIGIIGILIGFILMMSLDVLL